MLVPVVALMLQHVLFWAGAVLYLACQPTVFSWVCAA